MEELELWGGHECTVNRVGPDYFDQTVLSGHQGRIDDLDRFAELGLKATKPVKARRSMPNKLRAAELAAKAIDGIVSPLARPEERAQRRQRLTKGPPEFREDRIDLPKAKGK